MTESCTTPRVLLAAMKGGAGKTLLSIAVIAALKAKGRNVGAFKKGPDYIDAGWLGLAAEDVCYNLDVFLFGPNKVKESLATRSSGKDILIIEGNRGLHDGFDAQGSYSSAELAKLAGCPIVLIVDTTKTTRTAAALVLGCKAMDPDAKISGIILNRTGGRRHEKVLTESIQSATGIPVIGSVPKLSMENFPQRHLGLAPIHEHPGARKLIEQARGIAEAYIDQQAIIDIAGSAGPFEAAKSSVPSTLPAYSGLRIGVIRDAAFQFYYPENLEALEEKGARLVFCSAISDAVLPEMDALYIGGGFPETNAEALAGNVSFIDSVKTAAESGLPIYAECGGLMYLSRCLEIDDKRYPMVGVFRIDTQLQKRPQGLGYIKVRVGAGNPFYSEGAVLTGHEFHYSSMSGSGPESRLTFDVLRGHGMNGAKDGIVRYNALGTYLHVHALGEPLWAEGLLRKAWEYHVQKGGGVSALAAAK